MSQQVYIIDKVKFLINIFIFLEMNKTWKVSKINKWVERKLMNKTILGIIMLENICLFGKPMDTHTHILMSVGVEFLLIKSQGIQGQFRSGR